MGRVHSIARTEPGALAPARTLPRWLSAAAGVLALLVALPLMALIALAVRMTSHGRVLTREPAFDPAGRPVQLLAFRTVLDGGHTSAHERVRAVVGYEDRPPLTAVGRVLQVTRLARLPRLFNLAAGHTTLF